MPLIKKILSASCLCILLGAQVVWAAPGDEQLKESLRRILKENPEILFEVLSEHSDQVLDLVQNAAEARRREAMTANWDNDADQPKQLNFEGRPVFGRADAPVTIVAYSDFLCPFCEKAHLVVNDVLKEYSRDVRFVFKNYPLAKLHPNAEIAAKYYIAAGLQDSAKAMAMHDTLFSNQGRLARDGEEYLKTVGGAVGLDVERLSADAHGGKVAAMLAEDQGEARRMGIKGAPFFVVNDLILPGSPEHEVLVQAIQKALSLK